MAEMGLKAVLSAFVTIVVGIVFLVAIANSQVDATEVKTVTNESATLTNNTVTQLANTQLVSVTRVGNTTVTLVDGTDFTADLNHGQITPTFTNATLGNGAYDVSYTFRNVGNSAARTIVTLIKLFMALAVFLFFVGDMSPTFRDMMRFGK